MKIQAMVTGAFLLLSSGLAFAQSAATSRAIEEWLNGPEKESLQKLSDLAHAGDTDAQLVLGQIDRDTVPGGYSPYLKSLTVPERDALLRSAVPGHSKNWLLNLTDAGLEEYGRAIFDYRATRDSIGAALNLQKFGEAAAAEYLLWTTLDNGNFDKVNGIPSENYGLSNAPFLTWMREYVTSDNKSLTANRLLDVPAPGKFLGALSIKRLSRVMNLDKHWSEEIQQFILVLRGKGYDLPDDANLIDLHNDFIEAGAEVGPMSIVVRACEEMRQGDVDYECIVQAMEIIDGYRTLIAIRTPVENVIPAEDFLRSKRAVSIFKNLLRSRAHYYKRPIRSASLEAFLASPAE